MSNLPPPPPFAGAGPTGANTAGGPPDAVRTAAMLVYALLALNAVRTLLSIIAKDTLIDAYVDSKSSGVSREYLRDGAPNYVGVSIIQLVLFGAIMVFLAVQFSQGKNWARIVTLVLSGLGALGGLLSFAQPAPIWYQLLGALAGVLSLAVFVFLVKPESKQYCTGPR